MAVRRGSDLREDSEIRRMASAVLSALIDRFDRRIRPDVG
jgi:hypothetical protein